MQAFNEFGAEEDSIPWVKIKIYGASKLEPNDTNQAVPQIAERLRYLGFLDSSEVDTAKSKIYAPSLQEVISNFQLAHGLNADSVIGKSTVAMLNLSRQARADAMRCTMERLRWVDHYLQGEYVLVNAPQFKVYYVKGNSLIWQSRVVIGTTWNKTPNLTAEIERLVFNPTWTVPYSISSKEILPKLQKDSLHLVKQNMSLLDRSGNLVASTSVDYSQFDRDNFPYIIRQKPGGGNSLGLVKFHMPNPYYIFMHDTPSKRFFSKDQRTYSHGCIRLENPFDLAEILLKDTESWKPDTIQRILHTQEMTNYSLKAPLPIHILYFTCYVDADGQIYTLNDVYKRDEKLLEFLNH
jgi:murein L,D-transpeptidase YcbB/YkuD